MYQNETLAKSFGKLTVALMKISIFFLNSSADKRSSQFVGNIIKICFCTIIVK